MAIAEGNTASIDSDTQSDWVRLSAGTNRILIKGIGAGATRVDLEFSDNGTDVYTTSHQNLTMGSTLELLGVTGYVRMNAHQYDSGEVVLTVLSAITDRL